MDALRCLFGCLFCLVASIRAALNALALLLSLTLVAAEPASAAWSQGQEGTSGSAAVVGTMLPENPPPSADDASGNLPFSYDIASGSPVAARTGAGLGRVRHHTSPEALASIRQQGVVNPSRGGGVHVETQPFGPACAASQETGAFGRGAYVEFDSPLRRRAKIT